MSDTLYVLMVLASALSMGWGVVKLSRLVEVRRVRRQDASAALDEELARYDCHDPDCACGGPRRDMF